jgi:hypothetical protein
VYIRYMIQKLSEPVRVVFDLVPLSLTWAHQDYSIIQVGLHHTYLKGQALQHIYSVVAGDLFFRLRLDTTTLHWTLEEVSDGLPD